MLCRSVLVTSKVFVLAYPLLDPHDPLDPIDHPFRLFSTQLFTRAPFTNEMGAWLCFAPKCLSRGPFLFGSQRPCKVDLLIWGCSERESFASVNPVPIPFRIFYWSRLHILTRSFKVPLQLSISTLYSIKLVSCLYWLNLQYWTTSVLFSTRIFQYLIRSFSVF